MPSPTARCLWREGTFPQTVTHVFTPSPTSEAQWGQGDGGWGHAMVEGKVRPPPLNPLPHGALLVARGDFSADRGACFHPFSRQRSTRWG
ncbi:MAG UNVERIFIED_CONTAM: hypothetical protein LVT10_04985 [Anaerolineae bacterium]